jgi:hypothetical protein
MITDDPVGAWPGGIAGALASVLAVPNAHSGRDKRI